MLRRIFTIWLVGSFWALAGLLVFISLTSCAHQKATESCVIVHQDGEAAPSLACYDRFGVSRIRPLREVAGTHGCFPLADLRSCFDVSGAK